MGVVASVALYLLVYLLISGFITLCSSKRLTVNRNKGNIAVFVAATCLAVFAAVRFEVGTDYINYCYIYEEYSRQNLSGILTNGISIYNLGTFLFSKIALLFGGQKVFFGLYAFVISYMAFKFMEDNYFNLSLYLCSFLFLTSIFSDGLNIMKQTAAVAITAYALRYVYSKQLLKYVITIAIAMFHVTAIISLPIYFLYNKKNSEGKTSWKMIAAIILAGMLTANIQNILGMLGGAGIFSRYAMYASDVVRSGNNYSFILKFMVLLFLLMFRQRFISINPKNQLLFILMMIGVCFEFSGYFSTYVKRISIYYYNMPSIILMAQLPFFFKKDSRLVVKVLICAYAVSLFILSYVILRQSDIIPYQLYR